MSILSNPDKKLTLSQIYQWISDTFKYYKSGEVGWQNSIRHNLSLNKAFLKGEKSKDGKGHFWFIQEGCEEQFLKSRSSKKQLYQEIIDHISNKAPSSAIRSSSSSNSTGVQGKSSMNSLPSSPNMSHHDSAEEDLKPTKKRRTLEGAADYHSEYSQQDEDDGEDDANATREDIEDQDQENNGPSGSKRVKLTTTNILDPIENLGAPFLQWSNNSNAFGNRMINHHNANDNENGMQGSNSNGNVHAITGISDTPHFIFTESPNKPLLAGKNLTYTSSFSCNSNLELSPIRPSETGPLLEPLTPVNNIYKRMPISNESHPISQLNANLAYHVNHSTQAKSSNQHQVPFISLSQSPIIQSPFHSKIQLLQAPNNQHQSQQSQHQQLGSLQPLQHQHQQQMNVNSNHIHLPQPPVYITKTPKSNIKTPLRSLRSPQTSSILKKLCYSPSYIDDFYYSPLVSSSHGVLNSYDDDDLVSRAFESPAAKRLHATMSSSRKLFGELKNVELITANEKETTSSIKEDEK